MKRLYTLALSALVLAASATVAVPTARMAKSKISEFRSERIEKTSLPVRQAEMTKRSIANVRSVAATPEFSIKAQFATSAKAIRKVFPPRKTVTEAEGEWNKLEGKGKWFEGLLTLYSDVKKGQSWEIEVEENNQTPGLYRIYPYASQNPNPIATMIGQSDDETYVLVNATDPEKVYTTNRFQPFGLTLFSMINAENNFNGNNYGTLTDGVITFPANSFAYQGEDGWYVGNVDGDFKIVLPGADFKDYTFNVATDYICSIDNKATVNLTLGSDIAKVKALAVPSWSVNGERASATVDETGTEYPITSKTISIELTQPGMTSILVNAYNDAGEIVAYATTHNVYVADDAANWKDYNGTATLVEGFFSNVFTDVEATPVEVKVQENINTPGLYRIVNPYANHPIMGQFTVNHSAGHNHSIVINATDPDHAYVEMCSPGVTHIAVGSIFASSYADLYISSYGMTIEDVLELEASENEGVAPEDQVHYFGTMKDNIITLPGAAAMFGFNNEPYDFFNEGGLTLTLSPADEPDPKPSTATFVDFDFVNKQYGIDNGRGDGASYFKTASVDTANVHLDLTSYSGNGFRFWSDGLRVYKGSDSIVVTAPGHVISTVVLNMKSAKGTVALNDATATTLNVGQNVFNCGNLEEAKLDFTLTGTSAIETMTVVLDGEPGETKTIEVENIAAFLEAADANSTSKITGDVTVTYHNGKYLFVTDATGSLEVYGELDKTYTNGTKLSGIAGVYSMKNNMPQMTAKASAFTAGTQGEAVAPVEFDAATAQLGQYVELTDTAITETDGKFYIGDLQLYDQFKLEGLELKAAEKATVTGIYGVYNSVKEIFVTEVKYDGEGDDPVEETWTVMDGKGTWVDGFFTNDGSYNWFTVANNRWEITIEKSSIEGRYRMLPFGTGTKAAEYITTTYGVPADDANYVVIDATDPDSVYMAGQWTPYSQTSFEQCVPESEWPYDAEKDENPYGTLKDGIFTFPADAFAEYYEGEYYYANREGLFSIALPGYKIADYGLAASAGLCHEGDQTIDFSYVGADVASLKVVTIPGYVAKDDDYTEAMEQSGVQVNITEKSHVVKNSVPGINTTIVAGYNANGDSIGTVALQHFNQVESEENWKPVQGKVAKYSEGLVSSLFNNAETAELTCAVEEDADQPGRYRLVNPYATYTSEMTELTKHTHNHYLIINATDPTHVYVEPSVLGVSNGLYGEFWAWHVGAYLESYDIPVEMIEMFFGDVYGKMVDGTITMPDGSLMIAMTGYMQGALLEEYGLGFKVEIVDDGNQGGEDSINEISLQDGEDVYYNLRGQRISKPVTPGLYIRNNQKVLVK